MKIGAGVIVCGLVIAACATRRLTVGTLMA